MWGNKNKAYKKIHSLIGKDTEISGDLKFSGGLLIDGKVYGDITSNEDDNATLTISEYGYVEGEIHVPNVIINGNIEGDVYASIHLDLAGKSRIHGNVYYNLIEMVKGAEINGNLYHVNDEQHIPILEGKTEPARLETQDIVE